MKHDPVKDYYASFGEREWKRLENPDDGAVEFAVTCRMLEKYLPPNARVLDIGGGPGRYAVWLAERGHKVTLSDLSPELLEIARTKIASAGTSGNIEEIIEADACDLSHWQDEAFDAVLSLGPFYHLPDLEDRKLALSELRRVLRPGGLAFVSFMPVFTFLRRTLIIPDERCHLSDPAFVKRLTEEGVFINDVEGRFTHGYGVHPQQIIPLMEENGFTSLTLLAAEGIVGSIQRLLHDLKKNDPDLYETVLDMVINTAGDPSILGMAGHLLYIGRK